MRETQRLPVVDGSRKARVLLILSLVIVILGCLSVRRIVNGNGDLSGNYAVWKANLKAPIQPGRHVINELRLRDPDPYPPITYAIFSPLARLPLWGLATVWFLMNIACAYFLWNSLAGMINEVNYDESTFTVATGTIDPIGAGFSNQDESLKSIPFRSWPTISSLVSRFRNSLTNSRIQILAAVAVLPSVIGALLIGQNTLLVMTLVTAALRADVGRWPGALRAGMCLALAVAMKVLPVVFLLPYVVRRQVRPLVGFVLGGSILLFGIGSLFFGIEKNYEFHKRWVEFAIRGPENRPPDPHDPNTLRGSLRDKNQAIEAVLARLLMDVPIHSRSADAPRVNLASISPATWRLLSSSFLLTCVSICILTVIASHHAYGRINRDDRPQGNDASTSIINTAARRETVLGTLAILAPTQLFISPVLWSHYYLWLVFPIALILLEARRTQNHQPDRPAGVWVYFAWLSAIPCLGSEICRAIGLHLWMSLLIYLWVCYPAIKSLGLSNRRN